MGKRIVYDVKTQQIVEIDENFELPPRPIEEQKQERLNQLKSHFASLLSPTDYVLTRIQEAQAVGEDVDALIQKYQPKLDRRQAIRDWYKNTKQAILDAATQEELDSISIYFREEEQE